MSKIRIPLMGFNSSGGIRVVIEIANSLATRGWEVELVVPDYAATQKFLVLPVIQIRIIKTYGPYLVRLFCYLFRISKISCQQTDICLATYYLTAYPIYLSSYLARKHTHLIYLVQHYEPLAHASMGLQKSSFLKKGLYYFAKSTYRLPFKKIAVSHWIKAQLDQDMVTVIPNGVDLKVFDLPTMNSVHSTEIIIGTIGRPNPVKGLTVFLEAVQSFLERADVKVKVLTDDSLNLSPNIEVVRPTGDRSIGEFYQSCTLFVFPSLLEGFGLPPLEAMACGTAVVTTDCGGVREYAHEGNCLLVPPNDPSAIRQAIEHLLMDEAHRQQLVKEGRKTAQNFSLDIMLDAYQQFFVGLLESDMVK